MLRNNPEAFNTFVEVFVSVVIGRVRYSQLKFHKLLQNFCTESDEAFTLLLLENYWEAWIKMAKNE